MRFLDSFLTSGRAVIAIDSGAYARVVDDAGGRLDPHAGDKVLLPAQDETAPGGVRATNPPEGHNDRPTPVKIVARWSIPDRQTANTGT